MKPTQLLSRREFTTSLIAVPSLLRAQQNGLKARVKIDTERTIGEIDPKIYGNFIEHLGRCIDGGSISTRSRSSRTRTDFVATCCRRRGI